MDWLTFFASLATAVTTVVIALWAHRREQEKARISSIAEQRRIAFENAAEQQRLQLAYQERVEVREQTAWARVTAQLVDMERRFQLMSAENMELRQRMRELEEDLKEEKALTAAQAVTTKQLTERLRTMEVEMRALEEENRKLRNRLGTGEFKK